MMSGRFLAMRIKQGNALRCLEEYLAQSEHQHMLTLHVIITSVVNNLIPLYKPAMPILLLSRLKITTFSPSPVKNNLLVLKFYYQSLLPFPLGLDAV
jgi:hypothetical protein